MRKILLGFDYCLFWFLAAQLDVYTFAHLGVTAFSIAHCDPYTTQVYGMSIWSY